MARTAMAASMSNIDKNVNLKLGVVGRAREGNHVAYVLHARHKEHQALKAQTEAGVRHSAKLAGLEIPPQALGAHVATVDLGHEFVVVFLTHRAAYDLAYLREEHIGALHGLAIVVLLHVVGLDVLGIVDHDHRLLEVFLHQVALMLAGQVGAPAHGELKLVPLLLCLFQYLHTLGVGQVHKVFLEHALEPLDEAVVDHLVEEGQVVGAVVERIFHAVLDEVLLECHEAVELQEGDFGLYHPELGQVAGRVALLGAEGAVVTTDRAVFSTLHAEIQDLITNHSVPLNDLFSQKAKNG